MKPVLKKETAGRLCALCLLCAMLMGLCACAGGQPSPAPSAAPSPAPSAAPSPAVSAKPTAAPDAPKESGAPAQPEQTPEATSRPDPTPEQLEEYFDGALFIGDSILEGIHQYVARNRQTEPTLGGAKFLTSIAGVSASKLVRESELAEPYYRYGGKAQPILEILPKIKCERIFILLGLNDLADAGPVMEDILDSYSRLIDVFQQTVPGVEVFVITSPPKVASSWLPDYTPNRSFNNALIAEFVAGLTEMCEQKGVAYVDANTALKNEQGVLPDEYCHDGFVHLNDAGAKIVVEELYRFAKERL